LLVVPVSARVSKVLLPADLFPTARPVFHRHAFSY
jgi:hypothetical protein